MEVGQLKAFYAPTINRLRAHSLFLVCKSRFLKSNRENIRVIFPIRRLPVSRLIASRLSDKKKKKRREEKSSYPKVEARWASVTFVFRVAGASESSGECTAAELRQQWRRLPDRG